MKIKRADKVKDYDKIWDIFSAVIQTGNTYVFDSDTPKKALNKHWFADYMDTFVAVDNIDLGSPIANCSYMVNPNHQSRRIGELLCEHSIEFVKQKNI